MFCTLSDGSMKPPEGKRALSRRRRVGFFVEVGDGRGYLVDFE